MGKVCHFTGVCLGNSRTVRDLPQSHSSLVLTVCWVVLYLQLIKRSFTLCYSHAEVWTIGPVSVQDFNSYISGQCPCPCCRDADQIISVTLLTEAFLSLSRWPTASNAPGNTQSFINCFISLPWSTPHPASHQSYPDKSRRYDWWETN